MCSLAGRRKKLKEKKRNKPTTEKAQEKKSRQADSLMAKSRVAFDPAIPEGWRCQTKWPTEVINRAGFSVVACLSKELDGAVSIFESAR